MAELSDILITPAQLSDREQLVRFSEALWPTSSAEEHARELTMILEGKAVTTLQLIVFVAELDSEARDRTLDGLMEVDLC